MAILLEHGVPCDETKICTSLGATGTTPLHFASEHGHVEAVNLLLAFGADVHAICHAQLMFDDIGPRPEFPSKHYTPLHYASAGGHIQAMETLLENGACIDQKALHCAIQYGQLEALKYLLSKGANDTLEFHTSSQEIFMSKLSEPLLEPELQMNHMHMHLARSAYNLQVKSYQSHCREVRDNALGLAGRGGHVDVMKHLVEVAQWNYKPSLANGSALLSASQRGHVEAMKYLIDLGAHVNFSRNGDSPLSLVSSLGKVEAIELLVSRGAAVASNSLPNDDYTMHCENPLYCAILKGRLDAMDYLIELGAMKSNSEKEQALKVAKRSTCVKAVVDFLEGFHFDL